MKIGFIGCGNMATAMIKGILDSGKVTAEQMIASAKSDQTREKISSELGITAAKTNAEVVEFADMVFLAVKPQYYEEVIGEIKDAIRQNQIIVTIAPGKTLTWLAERLGSDVKIIRTMPNTPAMVKEGMMGMCKNALVTDEEMQQVKEICESFGKAEVVPESLIDVVVGVSGSSPAYVFMFIEAMADAAVADGMPRAQAYKFAAQSVLGSARMVLETGKHPGELKDMVCSPAGSTIQAVRVLEEKGFRGAVTDAVITAVEKSRSL